MKVQFFASGYCTGLNLSVNKRPLWKSSRYYAVWMLIQHPRWGNIVMDTGYSKHFLTHTVRFPNRLYRMATPVIYNENESMWKQLAKLNISTEDIDHVIVSHFHGDHVSGLVEFSRNTRFYCSQKALNELNRLTGLRGVRKGMIQELVPDSLRQKMSYVESFETGADTVSGLQFYNFLNDPAIRLVDLPGHAAGHIGIYLEEKNLFYAVDASWDSGTFEEGRMPSVLVNGLLSSRADLYSTWEKMKKFSENNKEVEIYFTHCPKTLKLLNRVI